MCLCFSLQSAGVFPVAMTKDDIDAFMLQQARDGAESVSSSGSGAGHANSDDVMEARLLAELEKTTFREWEGKLSLPPLPGSQQGRVEG